MASINMDAIMEKAQGCFEDKAVGGHDGDFKKRLLNSNSAAKEAAQVGEAFRDILRRQIDSAPGIDAIRHLMDGITVSAPKLLLLDAYQNPPRFIYEIDVSFNSTESERSRKSLQPRKYGGVDDIIAIFEHGYEAGGSVYGYWESKDKDVWSLQHREGAHFCLFATTELLLKYGKKYHLYDDYGIESKYLL